MARRCCQENTRSFRIWCFAWLMGRNAARLLAIAVVSIALAWPAAAGGRWHSYHGHHGYHGYHGHYGHRGYKHHFRGHRKHHRHRHHRRHKHDNRDVYTALGIVAGIGLIGALLAQPRYAVPTPVYPQHRYVPRARHCTKEQVYRYLPDGRIQWGEKTTCY